MLEVICAGSLLLSVNPCLQNNYPDLALINASQSTLVSTDVIQPEKFSGFYLAESEAEAEYRQNLEKLIDQFNIIIQDPNENLEDSSDRDAEQRRRELEQENGNYDRRIEDSGNDHESDYRQQAEDARDGDGDGYDADVSDSDGDEDSSDDDARERRRELEAEHQSDDDDENYDSRGEHTSDYRQQAEDARDGDFSNSDENSNSDEDEDSSDDDARERRQETGF